MIPTARIYNQRQKKNFILTTLIITYYIYTSYFYILGFGDSYQVLFIFLHCNSSGCLPGIFKKNLFFRMQPKRRREGGGEKGRDVYSGLKSSIFNINKI